MEFEDKGGGMGTDDNPDFWLTQGNRPSSSVHIAFTSSDPKRIDAFHAAALKAGGQDGGAPGPRPHYHRNYYGAFITDPDGNQIEAVCLLAG